MSSAALLVPRSTLECLVLPRYFYGPTVYPAFVIQLTVGHEQFTVRFGMHLILALYTKCLNAFQSIIRAGEPASVCAVNPAILGRTPAQKIDNRT